MSGDDGFEEQRERQRAYRPDEDDGAVESAPKPGKVSASQFWPPGPNPPATGRRVDTSSNFVGLLGGAVRSAVGSGGPSPLPAWVEPQLYNLLKMPVPAGDGQRAKQRVDMVLATCRALHRPMRAALLQRLEARDPGDELAQAFHYHLSTASRNRVFEVLRDQTPARTEDQAPTSAPKGAPKVAAADPWLHMFKERSVEVNKLGRIQATAGRTLFAQPIPGAQPVTSGPIPFGAPVMVLRRTTQATANERWCYVMATDQGASGFCEERYLALDPPDPAAKLIEVKPNDRLAVIAEDEYGTAEAQNNSRLYVQALYLANKDRHGIRLDHVELSFTERLTRTADNEETLRIYRGAQVLEGHTLWLPSPAFIARLKASGAVTSGSTAMVDAWRDAKEWANDAVEGIKYAAGFLIGMLEGAWDAIVDLFKGAVEMVEAVAKVLWHLISGNPGRIKDMLMGWVEKMKSAWEHRGEIADDFLKKWNAPSGWDRGRFQGETLGWVMMTVLLILLTIGASGPAAAGSVAAKAPQLVKLLQTVDAMGDVTTYLGGAIKAVKLPGRAIEVVRRTTSAAEDAVPRRGRGGPSGNSESPPSTDPFPQRKSSDQQGPTNLQGRGGPKRGEGAWETEAKPGEPRSPESIAHGTVKMEDHPEYQQLVDEATGKGFAVRWSGSARVANVHVLDESGALIEVRKELHLIRGMRFLDLEHEIGHLRQLDRFGAMPPPTAKVVRRQDGSEVEAAGDLNAGVLTSKQNAVVEYHNRLDEYIRLANRSAPKHILDEHAVWLDHWRIRAERSSLGRKGSLDEWAETYFNELPVLEKRARELGAKLDSKSGRWQPK